MSLFVFIKYKYNFNKMNCNKKNIKIINVECRLIST